jgi:alanyl aminopeptidase
MKRLLLATGLALCMPSFAADPAPPAFRLGDAARPLAYDVRLAIDPRVQEFTGEVRIELRFHRATPVLWLNSTKLTIESAQFRQGERIVTPRVIAGGADFVGFMPEGEGFEAGDAVATIRFRGPYEEVDADAVFRRQEGGDWYVVSQFEPFSARRAFPCFDEPGWKTPWKISIDAPAGDAVIANTPESGVEDLAERPGWRRHRFAVTQPLPSYLVAFAVGPFDVVDGGTAGARNTRLRHVAPKGRGAEMRFVVEATPRIVELLEEYFGLPYPFEKLDTVALPATLGFGAMENAGMITYSPELLLARPFEETHRFQRDYAFVGIHEIAHQWFGNLVTPAWWDDLWLNEAFATWMERKIVASYRPEWNSGWERGESRRRALGADRLSNARRVQNPVLAKDDVWGAFDAITYDKGSEVLSMFETWLGPERFRDGVRAYLAEHAGGSATSADFFAAIAKASGRPQSALAAFRAFVEQPGLPLVDVKLRCDAGHASVEVAQQRFRAAGSSAPDMQWTTPACFRHGAGGETHLQCEEIGNERRTFALKEANGCPDWIVGNADGAGHWLARYDAALAQRIAKHLPEVPENEAMALASDTALLAGAGLLSMDEGLRLDEALFAHRSMAVRQGGAFLLEQQRDEWLTPARLRKKREILARQVQPLARELGWTPREGESEAAGELRMFLLPYAAREAGGEGLRSEARALALRWVADHESIPAPIVPAVLQTAARFADRPTYEVLEGAALAEKAHRDGGELLKALVTVRDRRLRERAWSLALRDADGSPALDGRDSYLVTEKALQDDANREAAFVYVRAHWDALVAKLPTDSPMRLATPLGALCTREARAAYAGFFEARAALFLAGTKYYREALESIDICVAARSRP